MGSENRLYHFRKHLLQVLPQRLNDDFNLKLDPSNYEPQIPEIEDEDIAKQAEQEVVVSHYNKLLSSATSSGSPSRDRTCTPIGCRQRHDSAVREGERDVEISSSKHSNCQDDVSPVQCPEVEVLPDRNSALTSVSPAREDFPIPPYDEVNLSLETTEIRLLQLLPGEYDSPIVCNLFQIDSVKLYEYEALSYVWGSEERQKYIYVNDWELPVTANLELALRSLRDCSEIRLLWIDALCIDQSSVSEKTDQVAKMGDIYKAAKRVLIFLGPESQDSNVVFDFFEDGYSKLPDLGQNDDEGTLQGLQAAAYLIEHHQPLVKAWVEVLHRPWFSRLWVRQEYIRASEAPALYCGRRHVHFPKSAFNLLCEAVFLLPTLLKQPMADVIGDEKFHDIFARAVSVFQTMSSANNYPQSIDSWLYNEGISGCQAKDPRDLIFGISALFDSVAGSVLRADYSQSVEDVFMRASTWMLMMEQEPKMLVQYPPLQGVSIPSWVMDFTKARPTSRHHEFVATFDSDIFKSGEDEVPDNGEIYSQEENSAESEAKHQVSKRDVSNDDGRRSTSTFDQDGVTNTMDEENSTPLALVERNAEQQFLERTSPYSNRTDESEGFPTDLGLEEAHTESYVYFEHPTEGSKLDVENGQIEQELRPDSEDDHEPPTVYCTVHEQILSISGVTFDTIQDVFEIDATNRIDALRELWFLEKTFQSGLRTSSELGCLQNPALIMQWAVKLPINHMISTLVPRSEHYVGFLGAGLEDLSPDLTEENVEDLLGALLFDFEAFEAEMRTEPMVAAAGAKLHRYSKLIASLKATDEEKTEDLLDYLRELSNQILPSHLSTPAPLPTPRLTFTSSTASSDSGCGTSALSMLHSQPRTTEELLQAWENERDDIFSQLFQSCCFFQTREGFPGLGAFGLKGLQAGDVVTMLEGVPMPMVLRKHEEAERENELWRIVGPVVVRGIMNGEIKALIKDHVLEKKSFRIR